MIVAGMTVTQSSRDGLASESRLVTPTRDRVTVTDPDRDSRLRQSHGHPGRRQRDFSQ